MHGLENIELRRFMEGSIYAPCPESRQYLMETMLAVVLNLPVQRKCFGRVLLASWCAGDLVLLLVSPTVLGDVLDALVVVPGLGSPGGLPGLPSKIFRRCPCLQ